MKSIFQIHVLGRGRFIEPPVDPSFVDDDDLSMPELLIGRCLWLERSETFPQNVPFVKTR